MTFPLEIAIVEYSIRQKRTAQTDSLNVKTRIERRLNGISVVTMISILMSKNR
jgi:hypothetical protein